ncbi:MAG: cupin domain-containing protein [Methylobacteriaceae bacterium]|jgi:hypothetical protein|nr:cupin domain-containing protein [Methylobacteriaceae bacterium]
MSERVRELYLQVLKSARRQFSRGLDQGGDVAAETARVLDLFPDLDHPPPFTVPEPKPSHPLLTPLSAFLKQHPDLVPGLAELAPFLPWTYNYAPRADDPNLHERMGWFEFIGPDAPLHSLELGFGIGFSTGNVTYRPHIHPAAEIYCILAGHGDYHVDGEVRRLGPGDFSYHAPFAIHAAIRGDEPGMNIYSWTGDVVTLSKYVDEGI